MKIIFLDIDGVLNHESAYISGEIKYVGDKDFHYQTFSKSSKNLLNELILKTGAKIVISSTWRSDGLDKMIKIWESESMMGEIIGITPSFHHRDFSVPRGSEIKKFLELMNFRHINYSKEIQGEYMESSGIENYIIIDDDSDMLYNQRNHFVHVLPSPRNIEGFNEFYYKMALEKLNKNIIDLNF
jgi:hypothetical protein